MSFITTKYGTQILYKDWGEATQSRSIMADRSVRTRAISGYAERYG
jgi:hypothetical protein